MLHNNIHYFLRIICLGIVAIAGSANAMEAQPDKLEPLVLAFSNFTSTLEKYESKVTQLEEKILVSTTDIQQLSLLSKKMTTEVLNARANLIKIRAELVAENAWGSELDNFLMEEIQASNLPVDVQDKFISQVHSLGGVRAVINNSIVALTAAPIDIKMTSKAIQSKNMLLGFFIKDAYAKWGFWKCLGVLGIGVGAGLAGQVGATYVITATAAANCF